MIRLLFPIFIALALFISLAIKPFAAPDLVDRHTSDVPGCVTLTFADGRQQAHPVVLPAVQLQNSATSITSPCSGPVADPILWREKAGDEWLPVVRKTFCQCVDFDYANLKCKKLIGAC